MALAPEHTAHDHVSPLLFAPKSSALGKTESVGRHAPGVGATRAPDHREAAQLFPVGFPQRPTRCERERGRENDLANLRARYLYFALENFRTRFPQEYECARPNQRRKRGRKTNAPWANRARVFDSGVQAPLRFLEPWPHDGFSACWIEQDFLRSQA